MAAQEEEEEANAGAEGEGTAARRRGSDGEEEQEEPGLARSVPEKPSWLVDLLHGGPVAMVDLDSETSGWSSPPGDAFQVRGQDYLTSKLKVPAGDWLLEPLAFDWIKSTARVDAVLKDPRNRVMSAIADARKRGAVENPFVLAVNLQVPSKDHYSLVAYYFSTTPFPEGSLLEHFVRGDDEFRNTRLKLIANIVKGPWIVKTAVGDHAICLLGKSLTCRYIQGEDFLEVDVDIGSSMVASAIVHLAINYVTTLTVDLAFLIEGRSEEELPEKLLGSVRFAQLELTAAIAVEAPLTTAAIATAAAAATVQAPVDEANELEEEDEEEEEVDDFIGAIQEENGGSFQSRLWKSLGQGLSADWWGRQQS